MRFGFNFNGATVFCHEIDNANANTRSYMATGTLPVRQEIVNNSAISGAKTLKSFCMSVLTEGGEDPFPSQHLIDSDGIKAINDSSYRPVLAFRLKSEHARSQLVIKKIDIVSSTTDSLLFRVLINPTFSGGDWVDVDSDSVAQYNITLNNTVTGGDIVDGGAVARTNTATSTIGRTAIPIASDFDGVVDTVVIVVKSLNNNANVAASVVIEELY